MAVNLGIADLEGHFVVLASRRLQTLLLIIEVFDEFAPHLHLVFVINRQAVVVRARDIFKHQTTKIESARLQYIPGLILSTGVPWITPNIHIWIILT